ncbi:hypothetical protein [Kitasatospora sp. NPDC004531]
MTQDIVHPGRAALAGALRQAEARAGVVPRSGERSRARVIAEANALCGAQQVPELVDKTVSGWIREGIPAADPRQLLAFVQVLREWAERRASKSPGVRGAVPPGGRAATMPGARAVVRADEEVWRKRWEAARGADVAVPARPVPARPGQPVGRFHPVKDLEVHPAIDSSGSADPLPAFLRRPHDDRLRAEVEAGRRESRMAVLVADSSAGKTRSLWEAVRLLPEPWQVWRPAGPGELLRVLDGERSLAHTVLWLNESQRFLAGPDGGAVAEAVTALLLDARRGPVLVLGTLWRDAFATLTAERDGAVRPPTAALLTSAAVIVVPESFDAAALAALRLLAPQDPRLAEAIDRGGRRITQYLAGSPELVQRYETAPHEARALLDAAADARRMGHPEALTEPFLRAAGAAYLDPSHWQQQSEEWRGSWFERAVRYTSRACRGVPGPLVREAPPPGRAAGPESRYVLADYLLSYTRRAGVRGLCFPPQGFWDAVGAEVRSPGALLALARAADARYRYRIGEQLAFGAAGTEVLAGLAVSRANAEGPGVERLGRAAEERGDPSIGAELAEREAFLGRWEAEERLAEAGLSGVLAMRDLAEQQVQAGKWEDAEQLGFALAAIGEVQVLRLVAESMFAAGRRQDAERLACDTEDPYLLSRFAVRYAEDGHWGDAERLAHIADRGGPADAYGHLAAMHAGNGWWEEAERLARAATAGNSLALLALSRCAADAGKWDQAEAFAHEAGGLFALADLSRRRAHEGSWEEAERLAAESGVPSAFGSLARLRALAGEWDEAERLALAGGGSGLVHLVRQLAGARRWEHAERLARAAVDAGTAEALAWLAVKSARAGRTEEADRLWVETANVGLPWTIRDFRKARPFGPEGLDAEGRAVEAPGGLQGS